MTIRKITSDAIESGTITENLLHVAVSNKINAAYSTANTATGVSSGGYDQANAAYGQANTARNQANNAYASANLAYTQANNARSDANTTFATVNTSLSTINTNYQAAYAQANTARDTANNAYNNSNTKLSTSGGSISGDLSITGNLVVQGNATTINVSNLSVNDSIILLATGGTGDSTDIGFIGHFQRGATDTHAGLIRKATQNQFYLFDNYEVEPTNNVIDVAGNNFRVGNLRLGIINANSYVTSAGLDVTGQANAAYAQANAARSDANTTFATVNTTFGTINTNYQAAYAQANTARTTANDAYGQANAAYGAANNRVLKAGDTMTGNLTLSAASLVLSSTSNDQRLIDAEGTSATGRHVAFPLRFMIGSASTGYPFAGYNAIPRANGAYSYSTSDTAWGISYGNSSRMGFYYAASGTPGANITFSELMTIAASGNVGIGSGTPAQKLDVAGAVQSTDYRVASSAVFYLTGDEFRFRTTGGTERFRIDSSGNVGINTTTPGTARLYVRGQGSGGFNTIFEDPVASGYCWIQIKATGGGSNSSWQIGTYQSGLQFYNDNNSAFRVFFGDNGNVGINTTNPSTKLDVEGSGAGGLLHINNTTAGKSAMVFQDNGSQKLIIGLAGIWEGNSSTDAAIATETGSNIRFYTNGTATVRMFLDTSGNVAIGTTTAGEKLSVNGAIESLVDAAGGPSEGGQIILRAPSGGNTRWNMDNYTNKFRIFREDDSNKANGAAYFHIINGGNVGIGTDNPGNRLTVSGTIQAINGEISLTQNYGITWNNGDNYIKGIGGYHLQFTTYDGSSAQQEVLRITGGARTGAGGGGNMLVGHTSVTSLRTGSLSAAGAVGSSSGRYIYGWYSVAPQSSTTYTHLKTSLWGGGSPNGNIDYWMGGFEITGYVYSTNANVKQIIQFHNWSGTVNNNYQKTSYGSYDPDNIAYVGSDGYVYIRLVAGQYLAYRIDVNQYEMYSVRDVRVTAVTNSNSATL